MRIAFLNILWLLSVVALSSNEALHQRDIFYVGGEYVFNATFGGTILINKQYVEKLTPANGVRQQYPLVLVHSGGLSGTVCIFITHTHSLSLLSLLCQSDLTLLNDRNGSINQTVVPAGRRISLPWVIKFTLSTSGALDDQWVSIYQP